MYLKALRKRFDIPQEKMAKLTGVSVRTYSTYENYPEKIPKHYKKFMVLIAMIAEWKNEGVLDILQKLPE